MDSSLSCGCGLLSFRCGAVLSFDILLRTASIVLRIGLAILVPCRDAEPMLMRLGRHAASQLKEQ